MAAVLARHVIVKGKTIPAGTAQTAELKKAIPNPAAWQDDADTEPVNGQPPVPEK